MVQELFTKKSKININLKMHLTFHATKYLKSFLQWKNTIYYETKFVRM